MRFLFILTTFFSMTLFGQAPVINSFSPTKAGPGDTLTINGNNFNGTTQVNVGGSAVSFNIISNSIINAIVDINASSGTLNITNASGVGFLSGFTFDAIPIIDSFAPKNPYSGDEVTIYGKHLAPGWLGGSEMPTVLFGTNETNGYNINQQSYSKVSATVQCCPLGDQLILQTNFGADTAYGFSFLEPPSLNIFSFSPKSGLKDSVITIYGSYFKHVNISAVKFGNMPAASFNVISDQVINAVVGNGETGPISIYSNKGNTDSYTDIFFYGQPAPDVKSFTPEFAEYGEKISISGDNFTAPARVTIGGVDADSVEILSPQLITARVPFTVNSRFVAVFTSSGADSMSSFKFVYPVVLCPPTSSISLNADAVGAKYQWQVDTGTGFSNISDNANYTGTNMATLQLENIPSSWYNYRYRCNVSDFYAKGYSLKFKNTWTGNISSTWENPANWSCNSLPDSNTDIIIETGNVILNANTTCRSLIVKPGASLTVMPGIKINIQH